MDFKNTNPVALTAGVIVLLALAFIISLSFAFQGSVHF